MPIEIVVNGEAASRCRRARRSSACCSELDLDPARVAVELDRRIVKQPHWAETVLAPGAQIEIVQFVGGG